MCVVGASGCCAVSPGARAEQLIKTVPVIPNLAQSRRIFVRQVASKIKRSVQKEHAMKQELSNQIKNREYYIVKSQLG